MPKQIKQMKISQPQNQGKIHATPGLKKGPFDLRRGAAGAGAVGATNAVLNRHQLGIKLLFFAIDFGIVFLSSVASSWQRDNLFLFFFFFCLWLAS